MKIVSLVLQERFETYEVKLPEIWGFHFLKTQDSDEIIAACKGADCLLVPGTGAVISAYILERIPTIKFIQSAATGFNCVDTSMAAQLGIPVANIPGTNLNAVAEFTIGMIMALQRQIVIADREVKAGNFSTLRNSMLSKGIRELSGSKLGLVGLGAIGRQVARLAVVFGVSVSYFDIFHQSSEVEHELNVTFLPLNELLALNDIISIHVPLNEQTQNIINYRELSLMPQGSLFVNVSRGELVDQAGLAMALESGHLAGAAIDTLYPEPPGPDHPLLTLSAAACDRLIMTPHIAGTTAGAFKRMLEAVLDNISRVARDEQPRNIVNGVTKRRM